MTNPRAFRERSWSRALKRRFDWPSGPMPCAREHKQRLDIRHYFSNFGLKKRSGSGSRTAISESGVRLNGFRIENEAAMNVKDAAER